MKLYAVALLSLACTQAGAQDSPYTMNQGAFANYLSIQPMVYRLKDSHRTIFGQSVEQSMRGTRPQAGRHANGVAGTTSTVVPASAYVAGNTEQTIDRFTERLPPAQRAPAASVFRELLVKYRALERQFGIAPRDVAGAVAAYVAGCHMAYHNAPFPDAHFKPLVKQMQRTLAANPAFARVSAPELAQVYDEMALGGMLMATAQLANQAKPDPGAVASLRKAAGQQMQQFLGAEPDRVHISAAGLSLR